MAPHNTGSYSAREKLAPLEGTVPRDAFLLTPPANPPVSTHSVLPIFSLEAVAAGIESSEPRSQWLPPHLADTVCNWARAGSFLELPDATKVNRVRTLFSRARIEQ